VTLAFGPKTRYGGLVGKGDLPGLLMVPFCVHAPLKNPLALGSTRPHRLRNLMERSASPIYGFLLSYSGVDRAANQKAYEPVNERKLIPRSFRSYD